MLALLCFVVALTRGAESQCYELSVDWSYTAKGWFGKYKIDGIEYAGDGKEKNNVDFKLLVDGKECATIKKGTLKPHADGYIKANCEKETIGTRVSIKLGGAKLKVCGSKIWMRGRAICPENSVEVKSFDCKCKEGFSIKGNKCEKNKCAANMEKKGGKCVCVYGFEKNGKKCVRKQQTDDDCQSPVILGMDYKGSKAKTKTGKTCQAWAKQTPHKHNQNIVGMPDKSLGAAKNFCRNPDNSPGGVWCYTTDASKRWEYCNVQTCETPRVSSVCQTKTMLGRDYIGGVSKTKTGKTCQQWTEQSPHKHRQTSKNMPDKSLKEAGNRCRNPDNEPEGVWCYTTDKNKRWEYCNVDACEGRGNCQSKKTKGTDYAGQINKTRSGKGCQAWDKQTPHKHNKSTKFMPEKTLGQAKNYCRNPDKESKGVWCYTLDSKHRWEYCDVPYCEVSTDCQKKSDLGMGYSGKVNKSKSGKECQAWTKQSPHKHGQSPKLMPEKTLADAKNYCRNPDKETGVWCYTTDKGKRWEYCDVPLCEGTTNCQKKATKGMDYNGKVNKTKTGKKCQAWTAQSPHRHSQGPQRMQEKTLAEAKNYCRNPDREAGVWCYTTDKRKRWEYCDVPLCEGSTNCQKKATKGMDYNGKVNKTKTGKKCQAWTAQSPHRHSQGPQRMQEKTLAEAKNYCRNPDREAGVWCYTTDKKTRWEYCDVPLC